MIYVWLYASMILERALLENHFDSACNKTVNDVNHNLLHSKSVQAASQELPSLRAIAQCSIRLVLVPDLSDKVAVL